MKILLLLTIAALAALSSGCALFNSPYAAQTGDDIHELVCRTNEVIADGDSGKLSLADSRQFLKQSEAQVQVMRLRHVGAKAKPHLDDLDREYTVLLEQHSPLRRRTTSDLRSTLFALQSLRPVRSLHYGEGASINDYSSSDIATPDAPTSSRCDSGHGGHDGGGSGHK
ncbi:MAG TPA: hypothetical protein VK961_24195 [Chthoniobacter sp.]|nr:hypothetical protein [Chthoniobacter sp.]